MAASDTLTRDLEVPFTLTRSETDADGQTFEGYAAVFNTPAHIRDEDGEYDEVISPGSFAKTIREKPPKLLFNHGKHPLIGTMPLGPITNIREDARGLFVQARLSDNWLIQPVRDAIRDKAIDGMSFRMAIVKNDWSGRPSSRCRYGEMRTVREVRMPECGPVVFQAYSDTTAAVRSALRSLETQMPGVLRVSLLDREMGMDMDCDSVQGLVEDAIGALWGVDPVNSTIRTFHFDTGQIVFAIQGVNTGDHPGLWQANYTFTDGAVTLADPQTFAVFDPAARATEPEGAERQEIVGTSDEAVTTDTSDEAVTQTAQPTGPPLTLDERRRYARQVMAGQRGILSRSA